MSSPSKQQQRKPVDKQRAPKRQTCTHHAPCCGRHFHSLASFDAHHTEDGCDENATNSRTGAPLLEAWTENGYCALADGYNDKKPKHPVTIWTTAGLSERREALRGLQ